MPRMLVVAAGQTVNVETVLRLMDEAAGSGAAIICLPELSLTKYFGHWNTREYARMFDEVLGSITRAIRETAAHRTWATPSSSHELVLSEIDLDDVAEARTHRELSDS